MFANSDSNKNSYESALFCTSVSAKIVSSYYWYRLVLIVEHADLQKLWPRLAQGNCDFFGMSGSEPKNKKPQNFHDFEVLIVVSTDTYLG